jgi:hypothetical protein
MSEQLQQALEDCRCGETMTDRPCLACGNTTFTIAHPYHHNNTDFIYGIHKGCLPRLIKMAAAAPALRAQRRHDAAMAHASRLENALADLYDLVGRMNVDPVEGATTIGGQYVVSALEAARVALKAAAPAATVEA